MELLECSWLNGAEGFWFVRFRPNLSAKWENSRREIPASLNAFGAP